MKKARVRSTIFTSLLAATPALAEAPAPGCYARDYDAAHLAAHPAQGVAGVVLWLFDETPGSPAALVSARMADQGQGAADGVAGLDLVQYAFCEAGHAECFVECDGGSFDLAVVEGGLTLTTQHFAIGDNDTCGGTSNLAEAGALTSYRLAAAAPEVCAGLSRVHPIPGEGCWGVDYPDEGAGQGVLSLRLRLQAPMAERVFPLAQGVLALTLPEGGRAAQGGMGGARVSVPLWCGARDGLCWGSIDDGALRAVPEGEGLVLSTPGFAIWGPDGAVFDLAVEGVEALHRLTRLPDAACRGME